MIMKSKKRETFVRLLACVLSALLLFPLRVSATEDDRRDIPVETNDITGWPEGPVTTAKAAVVMEAETGVILYGKNMNAHVYPASTTKLMTALVAIENASLSEIVHVSANAVNLVPPDGSRVGLQAGDRITMEEALYCIMVGSANEVSNAIAEHVSGSIEAFAALMNERAATLSLTDTQFRNPNGLHEDGHYTSAHDLAIIAAAYFDHLTLAEIGGCARYHLHSATTQAKDFYINNRHRCVTGEVSLEGVIGGKTGFTDQAGDCLVTCAERDGVRLICVVLFEEAPAQYTDTVSLMEYGFKNFRKISARGLEESVFPSLPEFYVPGVSVFGRTTPSLSFAATDMLMLPLGTEPDNAAVRRSVTAGESGQVSVLTYTWNGHPIGQANVMLHTAAATPPPGQKTVFFRLGTWLLRLLMLLAAVSAVSCAIEGGYRHVTSREYRNKRRLARRKKESRRGPRLP
ncbi:MAG: D-alanyl-D-alanine carboxypeptidase [Lachnospiraceae bacterium]|nr:D-alanyl-D-alanine carboxypeptidase [Lachnospiraceae bacterium]